MCVFLFLPDEVKVDRQTSHRRNSWSNVRHSGFITTYNLSYPHLKKKADGKVSTVRDLQLHHIFLRLQMSQSHCSRKLLVWARLSVQAQPFPAIVTVYMSRGQLSFIGQPKIQCVVLTYFDPKNIRLFSHFMLTKFLVQTVQCNVHKI